MDFLSTIFHWFVDFVLHMDEHLATIVTNMGAWSYGLLFAVIFVETGVVIMPFLPGDSLLFAAGSIAAMGSFKVVLLWALMAVAAILGDTVNYWIGHFVGPRVFREEVKWLKREHLERTQKFYEKHGGKTIFLARFIPIIRTFAPFVAGIGRMRYGYFISYNIFGGLIWTALFVFGGYFFGNLPFVRDNFSIIIIAIIVISVIPAVIEVLKARKEKKVAPHVEPTVE